MNDAGFSRIDEIKKKLNSLNQERANLIKELADLRLQTGTDLPPLLGTQISCSPPTTPTAKIDLFRKLFVCRDDVFPKYWENSKSGKKQRIPSYRKMDYKVVASHGRKIDQVLYQESMFSEIR